MIPQYFLNNEGMEKCIGTRFNYNYVYDYIKKHNCELLSLEYKNMKQKLTLKCSCGETFDTTFNDFELKGVHHCKKCTNNLKSLARKIKYSYVKSYVESKNCKLISKGVSNAHEKINLTQEHDNRKNQYCKNNKLTLRRISYKDIDCLESILTNILHKHDNPVPSL